MTKRLHKMTAMAVVLLLIFSLAACGEKKQQAEETSYDQYAAKIDQEFSKEVMTKLSKFGDDPDTGNRSAGSPAEHQAAEYLQGVMQDIGLSHVTKEAVSVDGWTFQGANLTYKDDAGKDKKITLGGYATDIVASGEALQLVYLGKGTADDYEGVDVTNKLVLIDIDQNEDWWINYPAYQAKVKGAKAIIAMSIMEEENEDRIGSQDICGPADAPALAISQKDAKALQKMIEKADNKELTVTFNANSVIDPQAQSYNIWGEIPGKSDEVIYLIGHYDGYYHSIFDDASGIATCLGIMKAMVDSGYEPEKTIRVIAHGAEEFGKSGNQYDWATGAYEQITTNHPEWVEKAFALVNVDGGYPVKEEKNFAIDTSHELLAFTKESVKPVIDQYDYKFTFNAPAGTGTEDFAYAAAGIPVIVAGDAEDSIYYAGHYHSNMDSMEAAGFNDEVFLMNHQIYGKLIFDLDALAVRPMDFATRFESFAESIDDSILQDEELGKLVGEAKDEGTALQGKIAEANKNGTEEAAKFNKDIMKLYKQIQDDFLRLDCNENIIYPHEHYQANVDYLTKGIAALEKGDVAEAYDEYLTSIDTAWYATAFDEATCDYFVNQLFANRDGTWGAGMVQNPVCDIDAVIRSLAAKYEQENADVTAEIVQLREQLTVQQGYLDATVEKEKADLANVIEMMKAI